MVTQLPLVDTYPDTLGLLSPDLSDLVHGMLNEIRANRSDYEESDRWYNAVNYVKQIGIATDPRLRGIEVATGWARLAVESVIERFEPIGVRMPGALDMDDDLWNVWQDNNLDEECELVHTDFAIFGCSYVTVGMNEDGSPLVAVESPLTMTANYDARTRALTSALRQVNENTIVLYLPNETVWLVKESWGWVVQDRDEHNLGRVPVVRMANRQRAHDRMGQSEITPEVRSITAQACRALLNLAVAGEYYSTPQKYILGVLASDFTSPDGTPLSPQQAFMGKMLALPPIEDGEGKLPQVGTFEAYNPAVFTDVIDMYSKQMAAVLALPAHYLGFTTENPASAEAIASSQERLLKRAYRTRKPLSGGWEEVFRLVLLVRDGAIPEEAKRLELQWADLATPSIAATTDALSKQVSMGMLSGKSVVARTKAGYTPAEIDMLQQEDLQAQAQEVIRSFGVDLTAQDNPAQETADGTEPAGSTEG